jgi:hypothetical protein
VSTGTSFAIALLFFWMAAAAFFVAFHPGGIKLSDGTPAQNPSDVLKFFMTLAQSGKQTGSGTGGTGDTLA